MSETRRDPRWEVGAIARPLPAIGATMPCGRVYDIMDKVGAEAGLAVVEDGKPVGLASRKILMQNFAHPVTFALYEARPISLLMRRDPLIVETATPIDRVTELIATEKESALDEGFIVVDRNRFAGIGTISDLLNQSVKKARQQITELDRARAEAVRASESKSKFLANVSHELRTPLNSILGFTELIADGAAGEVTDKQAEYLGDIQKSGRRLLALINDLLDLSRAEAGRLELEEVTVELPLLVEETQRILMPRARTKNLALETGPVDAVTITGDEQKLLQVLINLANNAVKFTPEGGRITLGCTRADDGGAQMFVADDGPGIAEADRERIMEPFGRGRDTFTRQSEGAGLGLALTRILLELHGGRLTLDSRPGEGTRVTAHLPTSRVRTP
jgi:two-component system cell cycle sensor histidine kinase PleC